MGSLFKPAKSSTPATVPPPPAPDDREVQDAALRERRRRANAQGRASTIITGASGVEDEVTGRKTLLGS